MDRVDLKFGAQSPTLKAFWLSNAQIQGVMGPVGSAKTSTVLQKILKLSMEQAPNADGVRPTRWRVIRNTVTDLRGSTIQDWKRLFDEDWCGPMHGGPPPEHRIRFSMDDGTRVECDVMFLGMDDESHVRRAQGGNWTGAYINEAAEINVAVPRMVLSRIGRFPNEKDAGVRCTIGPQELNESTGEYDHLGVLLMDYNAPDEDHWLYEWAEEDTPENFAFFRQPPGVLKVDDQWVPNPEADNLHNLPGGQGYYRNQIAANRSKGEDWIKVFLANEYGYVQDGRPVYPEYSDSTHCREFPVDPDLPLLLGWDFGLTPAVMIAQLSRRGQLRFIDEICAEDMGVYQFARDVVRPHLLRTYGRVPVADGGFRRLEVELSWADPANTRVETDQSASIALLNDSDPESLRPPLDMGFVTEMASTNNPVRRQEAVRSFLTRMIDGAPALLIHPRCKMLRQGFNGKYCFRRLRVVGDERYRDVPEKNAWSHPHDAAQYVALAAQGGAAEPLEEHFYERHTDYATGY